MVDEAFDDVDGNGEIESPEVEIAHGRDADDLALEIEEGSSGITRIDVRGGLDVESATVIAIHGGHDPLADATGQAQRITNREYRFAGFDLVGGPQVDMLEGFRATFDFE